MKSLLVYDPTFRDTQSKARGVGRYLKTFHEASAVLKASISDSDNSTSFLNNYNIQFTESLKKIRKDYVLLNPFLNPIQAPSLFFKKTKKQIAVVHDLIPLKYKKMYPTGLKGWFFKILNKWSLRTYDAFVTDSNASKEDIIKYYKIPSNKIHVIYPSIGHIFLPHLDTKPEEPAHHHPFIHDNNNSQPEFTQISLREFTANPRIKNLKDYLLYVGDGTWNKNLPNIAKAIKMLNIPCIFVGSIFDEEKIKKLPPKPHPWQKSYYEFLKLAKDDNRFILAGFVSDYELKSLYKYAKLNLLLSYDEGFGYSFAEASYMSTPSLLSDIPVFHEIAGDCALFANPNDPREIAEKINRIFFDKYALEQLSIKAFDRAQNFNPIRFHSQFSLLVKSI